MNKQQLVDTLHEYVMDEISIGYDETTNNNDVDDIVEKIMADIIVESIVNDIDDRINDYFERND